MEGRILLPEMPLSNLRRLKFKNNKQRMKWKSTHEDFYSGSLILLYHNLLPAIELDNDFTSGAISSDIISQGIARNPSENAST